MELVLDEENIKIMQDLVDDKNEPKSHSVRLYDFLLAVRYIWHYVLHSQGVRQGEQLLLEDGTEVKVANRLQKKHEQSAQQDNKLT